MTQHRKETHSRTDIMHRRTVLPLTGCFCQGDGTVTIRTNSPAVLHAAVEANLIACAGAGSDSARWEIVAESPVDGITDPLTCNVIRNANTIYFDMGPRQWFAFDSETGNGAGFVAISNPDEMTDQNAIRYLRALIAHAVMGPQNGQKESQQA